VRAQARHLGRLLHAAHISDLASRRSRSWR
jgi:hypothetical protein